MAQTDCRRVARKLCGPGCEFVEGEETCRDKVRMTESSSGSRSVVMVQVVVRSVQTPEEDCDIAPVKTCNLQTKLLPRLEPVETCSEVRHV